MTEAVSGLDLVHLMIAIAGNNRLDVTQERVRGKERGVVRWNNFARRLVGVACTACRVLGAARSSRYPGFTRGVNVMHTPSMAIRLTWRWLTICLLPLTIPKPPGYGNSEENRGSLTDTAQSMYSLPVIRCGLPEQSLLSVV